LDLTLSSLKKYFKEWADQKYTIIYKHSNEFFKAGYDRCKELHPEFNWVLETNFRQNTIDAFNANGQPYTTFLVDDDIFINHFSIDTPEFKTFESNPNIYCLSPRLAPYINYCYTEKKPQPAPQFNADRTWNWKGLVGDWGYPPSIASFQIFRTARLQYLNGIHFRSPNYLEGGMCGNMPSEDLMICFETQKCICSTGNKVQVDNANHHDNTHSVEELNMGFVNGKRLSTEANDGLRYNMCHGPLRYDWN
jgi:hypothetical protein